VHDAFHFSGLYILHGERGPPGKGLFHRTLRHESDKPLHNAALLGDDERVGSPRDKTSIQTSIHESEAYCPGLFANAHHRRGFLMP
jgi:hypothetical protein